MADELGRETIPSQNDADRQMRQNALNVANQRAKDGASVQDVIKEAEELLAFLKSGGQVAAPQQ